MCMCGSVFRNALSEILNCNGYDSDKDGSYVPSSYSRDVSNFCEMPEEVNHVCTDTDGRSSSSSQLQSTRSRKRHRNPSNWKCNIRKAAREAGKEYKSVRNKIVPAKRLKTTKDCQNKCLYNCQKLISEIERQNIFERYYYTLNEHGKKLFLLATTTRFNVERHRKNKTNQNSGRKQTFSYYFEIRGQRIQVCKTYYLNTLSISQSCIYIPFKNRRYKYSGSPCPRQTQKIQDI